MVDERGDVLRPPHGTTPAAVKSNKKSEMRSLKSIHKKEGGLMKTFIRRKKCTDARPQIIWSYTRALLEHQTTERKDRLH